MPEGPTDDFWDQRYRDSPPYLYGERPNVFLVRHRALIRPGMRALAIADGEGRNGVWLAEQGAQVVAVDRSPTALARARELAERRGVELGTVEADLATWSWPRGSLDLVVSVFAHFGPGLRREVHRRIAAALAPGGVVVVQGFHVDQLGLDSGGPRSEEMLFTEARLREDFAGLEVVTCETYDAVLDEGAYHQGPAALMGVVAKRGE